MDYEQQLNRMRLRRELDFEKNMSGDTGDTSDTSDTKPNQISNLNDASNILPTYQFVIKFTNNHLIPYLEENIPTNQLKMHRLMHRIASTKPIVKCIYCFDIRKLNSIRHQIIKVENNYYYLQPDDHIELEKRLATLNDSSNSKYHETYFDNDTKQFVIDINFLDKINRDYLMSIKKN